MTNTYEIWTEPISASAEGRPVVIASVTDTAATALHTITEADAIDSVWLYATNNGSARVELKVVINPADDTNAANVGASELTYSLQASSTLLVMDGLRVREGTAAYTIGAYSDSTDDISITGYFVRKIYTEHTA